MDIIQDFIPVGRKNRPGRANAMKYITIHNTGNSDKGSGAKNHANYIKGDTAANEPVSWHYTVDEFGAYQHVPDNEIAWHAGDGAKGIGNNESIAIEICMNSDGNLLGATDNAVELTASLCKKYDIPVENIVQHNKWSGKNCPQQLRSGQPYSWDAFIGKVRDILNPPAPPVSTDYKIGDIVNFKGGYHYPQSGKSKAVGGVRKAGTAKITNISKGASHPYHLIGESSNVYGWVDAENIEGAAVAPPPAPGKKSIDEIAREVINGKWGNGQVRKDKLAAAGYDASVVQKRVNQLLK